MEQPNAPTATIINFSDAREKRQASIETEEQLLAMFEEEVRKNPSGTFNQIELEDGSTRITATVPPGTDPEQFVTESIRATKELQEKF